jgi:hypothetical protein
MRSALIVGLLFATVTATVHVREGAADARPVRSTVRVVAAQFVRATRNIRDGF